MTTTETPEKVINSVIGELKGITETPSGWTHIAVLPDGASRTMNLGTKRQPLIEMARAAGSGRMVWTFEERDGKNINPHTGEPFKDRYFESVAPLDGTENLPNATTPAAAPQVHAGSKEGLSKEEWRRKDIAADKRAYTAIAAGALQHTMPSDPSKEDLNKFMERVSHLTVSWMKVQNALRDGEDIAPF